MTGELDELWARFLDGEALGDDEAARLHAALLADEPLRRARLRDRQIDGLLRGLPAAREGGDAFVREFYGRVAAERSAEPFVSTLDARVRAELRAPRRRSPIGPVMVGANLATLIVAAVALRRHDRAGDRTPVMAGDDAPAALAPPRPATPAEMATVTTVRGTAYVVTDGRESSTAGGQPLPAGAGLITVGPGSAARVGYADGTWLELAGDAALASVAGKRGFLGAGTLRASVAPQRPGHPLVIATPHAEAVVLGTRFSLQVGPAETRLGVEQGRVRFSRTLGGGEAVVAAGQQSTASERVAPVASLAAPGGTAVFVVGSLTLSAGDEAVRRRLAALGFEVKVRAPGLLLDSELRSAAVVLLSSTIPSVDMNTPFRELPVPIVCWENRLFDDLGIAGSEDNHEGGVLREGLSEVLIKDPLHPLAAGLAGPVRLVASSASLTWGTAAPLAAWIATYPERPTRAALFAYEQGTPLTGGEGAAARRVGIFLYDETAAVLTPAGWALFDAAVRWAAERRADP